MLKNLIKNPNRIAVYLTAIASLIGGLAPAVADLDFSSTVGVLGGVIAIVSVVRKWLDGWQNMESANYQAQIMARQHAAQVEAAAQVGRPGSRRSSVAVPR